MALPLKSAANRGGGGNISVGSSTGNVGLGTPHSTPGRAAMRKVRAASPDPGLQSAASGSAPGGMTSYVKGNRAPKTGSR